MKLTEPLHERPPTSIRLTASRDDSLTSQAQDTVRILREYHAVSIRSTLSDVARTTGESRPGGSSTSGILPPRSSACHRTIVNTQQSSEQLRHVRNVHHSIDIF